MPFDTGVVRYCDWPRKSTTADLVTGFLGLDSGFCAERFCFVGEFPGKAFPGATEVAEGSRFAVDGTAELERLDHAFGRELEVIANQFG